MKIEKPLLDGANQANLISVSSEETTALTQAKTLLVFDSEPILNQLKELWQQSEQRNGPMLQCKGALVQKVNSLGIAGFLAMATGIVFESIEKTLWVKESARGLWLQLDEDDLATRILDFLNAFIKKAFEKSFVFVAKQSLANEIVRRMKHFAAKPGFFNVAHGCYVLHCLNCFLVYDAATGTFLERSLDDESIHSRHQLNAKYDPSAQCPRFLDELVSPIISEDEIRVLFEYIGQVFVGRNISQKVLIFSGAAGGGKSTIVNIAEMMLGRENVMELRTNALHGWYETSRYIGKSLLTGKDVPADFMRHHGASKIKALTGNDMISTEKKHSNEVSTFAGTLNVIITSNCNQPIQLQDDRDAWERRILSIKCKAPKEAIKPIRDFDKILVETEGSGILNLALEGFKRIIKAGGTIIASEKQKREIADLLDESEGIRMFLLECVENGEKGNNLTSEELFIDYKRYCATRGWKPRSYAVVCKELVDVMPELFDSFRRTDIIRNGTQHRGYWGIRLKSQSN